TYWEQNPGGATPSMVQGRAQKVCKYTEDQGRKLGVVGWVKNTARGTVTGQVQGPKEKVEIMKNWLRSVGSPMSRIDRAVFSNEREIPSLEFQSFTTKY
uniref:acylphosphatase n=1 Tax=Varanus komodoensis TaxID=61221 RepID=A0A8D2Q5P1_VARKO